MTKKETKIALHLLKTRKYAAKFDPSNKSIGTNARYSTTAGIEI
jgi:hypothetical protein